MYLTKTKLGLSAVIAATVMTAFLTFRPSIGAAPLDEVEAQAQSEWFADWTMESRVAKAQLIMVARVHSVSPLSVVRGAKADINLREYRIKPVSILKGVFTRLELAMTDSDLGLPAPQPNIEAPLKEDEHILLILSRSRTTGVFCCVALPQGIDEPRQLIPRLKNVDDPIVSMTETMIRMSQSRSQEQRVRECVRELRATTGPSTVPLLLSLASRGFWVQSDDDAKLLAELTDNDSRSIRMAAASIVCRVLAADAPIQEDGVKRLADALQTLLNSKTVPTYLRTDALKGLGYLGEFGRRTDWVSQLLLDHLQNAQTHAERSAAATALARLNNPETIDAVLAALQTLQLDEYKTWESAYIEAAVKLAKTKAAPLLLDRLKRKLNGGHAAVPEIRQLGVLKHSESVPALIRAAGDGKHRDEIPIADAFAAIKDARAVPALADLLESSNEKIRSAAVKALNAIDTDTAVAALRPRLNAETNLALKLHMAEVLGRHGFNDGYNIALEHLADPGMSKTAARTLAAINDPRTSPQLWKSVEESHDTAWTGAALQGLAALKDPNVAARLRDILSDQRSPLLLAAIAAADTLNAPELLAGITPHVLSRNFQIASESITAVKTLAAAARQNTAYADSLEQAGAALIKVLNDPDMHANLRMAALSALQELKDERLAATLRTLANDALPANSQLQQQIHAAMTAS